MSIIWRLQPVPWVRVHRSTIERNPLVAAIQRYIKVCAEEAVKAGKKVARVDLP